MTKRKMNNQPGLFDADPAPRVEREREKKTIPFRIGDRVQWAKRLGPGKWVYVVEAIHPTRIVCAGPGGSTLSTTPDMLEKVV